ncbi:MAG: MTH1187 family thiamine-binding protein [Candidatus Atribacteria bacterium]|jgi:uncharacterized protein (TIGR00106 family)|nr:MTH1187 family thiamine-binding protein [Candidatus Atribacteria bacterium]
MPRVNVSFQILPIVKEERIYEIVDKVIKYIDKSGVKYEVGAMETTLEGDYDKLMDIVKESQQICVREGVPRIVSIVKIDYKPEGVTIDEKVKKYRK